MTTQNRELMACPVPPRWYTLQEIEHCLLRMNYSEAVIAELAAWFFRHIQSAYNKGFRMGANTRHPADNATIRDERKGDGDRCEYCDGTGDVHGLDGEWRGKCTICDANKDTEYVGVANVIRQMRNCATDISKTKSLTGAWVSDTLSWFADELANLRSDARGDKGVEAVACLDYTHPGAPIVTWFKPLKPGKHEVYATSRASDGDVRDAKRYRWLREGPEDRDVMNNKMPWCVQVTSHASIPTIAAISSIELDAAIDAAIASATGEGNG